MSDISAPNSVLVQLVWNAESIAFRNLENAYAARAKMGMDPLDRHELATLQTELQLLLMRVAKNVEEGKTHTLEELPQTLNTILQESLKEMTKDSPTTYVKKRAELSLAMDCIANALGIEHQYIAASSHTRSGGIAL